MAATRPPPRRTAQHIQVDQVWHASQPRCRANESGEAHLFPPLPLSLCCWRERGVGVGGFAAVVYSQAITQCLRAGTEWRRRNLPAGGTWTRKHTPTGSPVRTRCRAFSPAFGRPRLARSQVLMRPPAWKRTSQVGCHGYDWSHLHPVLRCVRRVLCCAHGSGGSVTCSISLSKLPSRRKQSSTRR